MEFENLIAGISTQFITISSEQINKAIDEALQSIGIFAGVDRSYIFVFHENGTRFTNTHEWCAAGIEPQIMKLQALSTDDLPWIMNKIRNRETAHIPSVAELPPEAGAEKNDFQSQGIRSLICVPMVFSDSVVGFLGFDSVREEKNWPEDIIALLNMICGLFVNALERKRAEEELKATQGQLMQQEKMASIGQLAAGVAHEINNPMGFISSNLVSMEKYLERLKEFIKTQSQALDAVASPQLTSEIAEARKKLKIDHVMSDAHNLLSESKDGAERVRIIVQNLKTFSRVNEAEYKYADINECLESSITIVWNELKYKAEIDREYGELPPVRCFPQQLNQVFLNILVNAAQAIEIHGNLTVKTWQDRGDICVAISDTGPGIPKKIQGRIFEPFFTTKEVGKGTGLGLSISYDIVKKHGGTIIVDSTMGVGTTFTIRLPLNNDL